jgi:hypothetical protein
VGVFPGSALGRALVGVLAGGRRQKPIMLSNRNVTHELKLNNLTCGYFANRKEHRQGLMNRIDPGRIYLLPDFLHRLPFALNTQNDILEGVVLIKLPQIGIMNRK